MTDSLRVFILTSKEYKKVELKLAQTILKKYSNENSYQKLSYRILYTVFGLQETIFYFVNLLDAIQTSFRISANGRSAASH